MIEDRGLNLATNDSSGLTFDVIPSWCGEGDVLFGGWALAMATQVAQVGSGRGIRSLSTSFLLPVRIGDELEFTLTELHVGNRISQLRVDGRVGERLVTSNLVTLGSRVDTVLSPHTAPAVRSPWEAPERTYRFRAPGSAVELLDVRLAAEEPEPGDGVDGRALLWARVRRPLAPELAIALFSDHLPYLVVRSFHGVQRATTVSATVRWTAQPEGEWLLLDVRLTTQDSVFVVGSVNVWSEVGQLVATAEQTTYIVLV